MPSGACGSSAADLAGARARLLAAREAREERIRRLCAALPGGCLVAVGLSVPGADKAPRGSGRAVALAVSLLAERCAAAGIAAGPAAGASGGAAGGPDDSALGPFAALAVTAPPERTKALCVELEGALPWGRVLDLDVYAAAGGSGLRELGRAALGLPGRRCLLCDEPARECILLRRHEPAALAGRTATLLGEAERSARVRDLAAALERGARAELDLTPKPGLVDRRDNGSHPDLDHAAMTRSIDLLPRYFRELVAVLESAPDRGPSPAGPLDAGTLARCVEAGRAAEARMLEAVGANAHRGFIFLSGLVLLAAWEAGTLAPERLRPALGAVARRFFARAAGPGADRGDAPRPGATLRRERGIGGIAAEALAGLPGVFERALPQLAAPAPGGAEERRAFRAMAALMAGLEDTTAIHRCGSGGLERVRRDGRSLAALLDRGEDPAPRLALWNEEYRALGLTMGGVADCLAVALALADCGLPALHADGAGD
jgi:holo-ACP synthase CitX